MCKNLLEKGDFERPLFLYNRTTSRAKTFSAQIGHSVTANTVEEAVSEAEIIFSCLTDAAAVNETFGTILMHNVQDKLFVECSTTQSEHINELARKVEESREAFCCYARYESLKRCCFRVLTICLPE